MAGPLIQLEAVTKSFAQRGLFRPTHGAPAVDAVTLSVASLRPNSLTRPTTNDPNCLSPPARTKYSISSLSLTQPPARELLAVKPPQ